MAKVKFKTVTPTAPRAGEMMPAQRPPAEALSPIGDTIPEPYEATGEGALTPEERQYLADAEAALEGLRTSFVRAGKWLAVVQKAKLYREEFATFEEFVEERWKMGRAYAYRLIQAAPIAEALSPIGDKVNESQVRELLPVAARHGQDAAVAVYRTVAEVDGVKVTAAVLKAAAAVVPEQWDEDEAAQAIRARLLGEDEVVEADPVQAFTVETQRIRRALGGRRFRQAVRQVPAAERRAFAAQLRELAEELEGEE